MKKHKKFNRIHKSAKMLGAVLLGALVFSQGVLAYPIKSTVSQKLEAMGVVKAITQNELNYIEQWNKEFSDS